MVPAGPFRYKPTGSGLSIYQNVGQGYREEARELERPKATESTYMKKSGWITYMYTEINKGRMMSL